MPDILLTRAHATAGLRAALDHFEDGDLREVLLDTVLRSVLATLEGQS